LKRCKVGKAEKCFLPFVDDIVAEKAKAENCKYVDE